MRLLVALSGDFLPPADLFAPWGWLSDGRMLAELPGVSVLPSTDNAERDVEQERDAA